jgi:hypothetical protein
MGYEEYESIERPTERSRWTPLTRMLLSGEMTQEKQQELTAREKFDRWMINEGYRRVYVAPKGTRGARIMEKKQNKNPIADQGE